jgi:hypothetical protein
MLVIVGSLAVLSGRAHAAGEESMNSVSKNFTITFHWRGPSVPPPYHYEYRITVTQTGAGEIVMTPGYSAKDAPQWTETFAVDAKALGGLRETLRTGTSAPEKDGPRPVGGATASAEITEDGATTSKIDAAPTNDPRMNSIEKAFETIVPPEIWSGLKAKQEEYVASHPRTRGE